MCTVAETSEMETVEGACSFPSNGICHVTLSVSELCRAISLCDAGHVTETPKDLLLVTFHIYHPVIR